MSVPDGIKEFVEKVRWVLQRDLCPENEEDTSGSSTSFEEDTSGSSTSVEGEEGDSSSDSWLDDFDGLTPDQKKNLFHECLNELGYKECVICDHYIKTEEFQKHFALHWLTCYICGREELKPNEEFAEHCSSHNVGGKCEIDGCSFRAISRINLWEHANTKHTMISPYICLQCGGSFATYSELVFHGQEVHNS